MVLGKLLVPGRPTIWIRVGQGPTFSLFSLSLWVGCFGFSGPSRQHFSLYRAVSQRE